MTSPTSLLKSWPKWASTFTTSSIILCGDSRSGSKLTSTGEPVSLYAVPSLSWGGGNYRGSFETGVLTNCSSHKQPPGGTCQHVWSFLVEVDRQSQKSEESKPDWRTPQSDSNGSVVLTNSLGLKWWTIRAHILSDLTTKWFLSHEPT